MIVTLSVILAAIAASSGIVFLAATQKTRTYPHKVDGYGMRATTPWLLGLTPLFLSRFRSEWLRSFEYDPKPELDKILLSWEDKPWRVNVAGETISKTQIKVLRELHLNRTALAHELTHAILWQRFGDPDVDHHGKGKGVWSEEHNKLIERVNA